MKIGITINLGNYESLRFDTSDLEELGECQAEIMVFMEEYKDFINERIKKVFKFE